MQIHGHGESALEAAAHSAVVMLALHGGPESNEAVQRHLEAISRALCPWQETVQDPREASELILVAFCAGSGTWRILHCKTPTNGAVMMIGLHGGREANGAVQRHLEDLIRALSPLQPSLQVVLGAANLIPGGVFAGSWTWRILLWRRQPIALW